MQLLFMSTAREQQPPHASDLDREYDGALAAAAARGGMLKVWLAEKGGGGAQEHAFECRGRDRAWQHALKVLVLSQSRSDA